MNIPSRRASAALALLIAVISAAGCQDDGDISRSSTTDAQRAARIKLGRDLFFDPRFSADRSISCASCHDIESGGADGLRTAVGIHGAVGPINTPTVLNSRLNFAQFWDGRADTLQEQVGGPINNPKEMGGSWNQVLERLSQDSNLVARFEQAYPDGLSASNVADAIAGYESSLLTLNSPFDRYQDGDTSALSAKARQGYSQFQALGCASCHQGRAFGGNMFQRFGVMGDYFADRGLPITEADLGRYNVTGREEDKYRFKVPSLRNVARTAPYFHDGSAPTLREAVSLMSRYQVGEPISDEQIDKIVAFLESLNGEVETAINK